VEVGDSAAGAPVIEEFEIEAGAQWQSVLTTTQHDRPEEQVALVYHPRLNRLSCEICSTHR
jgi:hypothetical protein